MGDGVYVGVGDAVYVGVGDGVYAGVLVAACIHPESNRRKTAIRTTSVILGI